MKSSENKDILIIITGCAFRSSSIPLLRNYFTNQNLCDTFIQQSTLSRTKLPNFRFLAYKLVYLMIVIESVIPLTYLPRFQYRLQVLLGFVERSSSILWLVSSNAIACIISSNLWHSLSFLQHIINWKIL